MNELLDTNFVYHYNRVMINVTITMEEEVARWARIKAAERGTSVSRLVGEMLREKMLFEQAYLSARQRYLSKAPQRISEPGENYPSREQVHER